VLVGYYYLLPSALKMAKNLAKRVGMTVKLDHCMKTGIILYNRIEALDCDQKTLKNETCLPGRRH